LANPYVYGGISITRKTGNRFALPAGEDPLKWIDYLDVNAIIDLLEKTATAAPFHAFAATATKPTELGASQRGLWVDSDDNKLYYWDGSTSTDVTAGGGGGGHTIQNGGSNLTARTGLNFDGTELVATDDAGNNQTDVVLAAVLGAKTFRNATGGTPGLVVDKTQGSAGAYDLVHFKRNDVEVGSVELDASDRLLINSVVATRLGGPSVTVVNAFFSSNADFTNSAAGTAVVKINKDQGSAGSYTLVDIQRGAASKATLGLDGNDELQITGSAWGVKVTGGVHVLELSNSSGTVLRANGVVGFNMDANRAYRDGRWSDKKGANVAIAATLTLGVAGNGGNLYEVTGSGTAVDRITGTDWQDGAVVTLWFSNTTSNTVNHGTAASGADLGIKLAGSANFTSGTSGFSTLTLRKTAGWWIEAGRSIG
jgi:hypothetical protein